MYKMKKHTWSSIAYMWYARYALSIHLYPCLFLVSICHRNGSSLLFFKKVIKQAKGYRGRSKNVFRIAIEKVEKGLQYAYRDRRAKKRNFRGLWIQRINAGVREHGMSYSQFISGIKKAEIDIDRKILADIAKNNPTTFKFIVDKIRQTK